MWRNQWKKLILVADNIEIVEVVQEQNPHETVEAGEPLNDEVRKQIIQKHINKLEQVVELSAGIFTCANSVESTSELFESWRKQSEEIRKVYQVEDVYLEIDSEYPLWNLMMSLISCLRGIVVIYENVRELQTSAEKCIDFLSLQQNRSVQKCVNLLMGYTLRNLVLPEFSSNNRAFDITTGVIKELTTAEGNLELGKVFLRLEVILLMVYEFTLSRNIVFQQFIQRTSIQSVIFSLIQFLYYPVTAINNEDIRSMVETIRPTVSTIWQKHIFRCFPIRDIIQTFLIQLQPSSGSMAGFCSRKAVREIFSQELRLKQIIENFGPDTKWVEGDYAIFYALLKTVIDDLKSSEEREKIIEDLGYQCQQMIHEHRNTNVKKMSLYVALNLSTCNHALMNRVCWGKVFKPMVDLLDETNSIPVKITDLLDVIKISQHFFDLHRDASSKILLFQRGWNGIFAAYAAMSEYLENSSLTETKVKFLVYARDLLSDFIVRLILYVHEITDPTRTLLQYCVNMVLNASRSPKSEKLAPIFLNLSGFQSEEEDEYIVQRLPVNSMCKDEVTSLLSAKTIQMHRLITQASDEHSCESLVKDFFKELLKSQYNVVNINAGEKGTTTTSSFSRRGFLSFKDSSNEELELLDFKPAEKIVTLIFLSEFGYSEHHMEKLLEKIELDEDSFNFLVFAIERIETEISGWRNDLSNPTEEARIPLFTSSLVQSLEMIEHLCEATYEEERKENFASANRSDDKIVKALTGWKKMRKFVTFLNRVKELKQDFIISLGIPQKCLDLIIFIETRGRGVKKNVGRENEMKLSEVLFSINSNSPAFVGQGLIELKKLIYQRHPDVERKFQMILQSLEAVLHGDDEYVYNLSINALVSLTIEHHEKLVPRMVELYGAFVPNLDAAGRKMEGNQALRYQLKIGEVLSKTFTSLGPIFTKYVNAIFNTGFMLSGPENLVEMRVSAYQVVAALVPELVMTMDQYIVRLWHWTRHNLEIEKEVSVKLSIWGLLEKLICGVVEVVNRTGRVGNDTGSFVLDIFSLSKVEIYTEDERLAAARNKVRNKTRNLVEAIMLSHQDAKVSNRRF